jgi:hypothetical protein
MLSRVIGRLTYANLVSTLCLFMLLGGGAYAAATLTGRDIKNESLTGRDIKNLTTNDIKDFSLLLKDFKQGQLPSSVGPPGPPGATGATGAAGATGQTGPEGPAGISGLEVVFDEGPFVITGQSTATVSCTGGKKIIGGGGNYETTVGGDDGKIDLQTSRPITTSPQGWTAVVDDNTGTNDDYRAVAYAICANVSA